MTTKGSDKRSVSGYPNYPPGDDIYLHFKEEDIDPEDLSRSKDSDIHAGPMNEKDFSEDVSGSDLDIPGVDQDAIPNNPEIEDEENNYYSLGGDDHTNLDENQGE